MQMKLILGPNDAFRLGDFLIEGLEGDAVSFRGLSAFARKSGISHLFSGISAFSATRPFQLTVGVDLQGTSIEALEMLLDAASATAEVLIFHNPGAPTFHPKLFRFEYSDLTELYVGSGNLTRGGLFTNYEAGILYTMKAGHDGDHGAKVALEASIDRWSDTNNPTTVALTPDVIQQLVDDGLICSEKTIIAANSDKRKAPSKGLFGSEKTRGAPSSPVAEPEKSVAEINSSNDHVTTFVMTLEQSDAGDTPKRSPEFFVPIRARDMRPQFWGWPDRYEPKGVARNRYDVPFVFRGNAEPLTIFGYSNRSEFRIRNRTMRLAASVGDIFRVRHDESNPDSIYEAEIVRPSELEYAELLAKCDQKATASTRVYGYF